MASDYAERIDKVDWSAFKTAYGVATDVGNQLKLLTSQHHATASDAAHNLWCSLCHQYAYVSSAALPAYPFLLEFLEKADAEFTAEVLDIFLGFALCSVSEDGSPSLLEWQRELRRLLINEVPRFIELAGHEDEDVAYYAEKLVESLA